MYSTFTFWFCLLITIASSISSLSIFVFISSKDNFWGAYEKGDYAEGYNILGLLLKYMRKDYIMNQDKKYIILACPKIENFKLIGHTIGDIKVDITQNYHLGETYNLFDDFGL